MASNFHNILGFLAVGVDYHLGLQVLTVPPDPEFPFWEVVCMHPFVMGPNQKPTVQINGVASVVDQHTPMLLWPHFPIDPMNALFALDMLLGTQSCWLPRGTVLICGSVSTCCVAEGVSVNLDCWTPCSVPSDLVLQYATVQTTPSPGDYAFGVLRAAISAAVSAGTNYGFAKLGELAKGGRFGKFLNFGEKLDQKIVKLAHGGLGQKLAKRLGSMFMKDGEGDLRKDLEEKFAAKILEGGLKKKSLEERIELSAAGHAQSVGTHVVRSILSRFGLGKGGIGPLATRAEYASGFDPSRMLPPSVGNTNTKGGFGPFGGFPGAGQVADHTVPLYGGVHGGVQALIEGF